MSLPDRSKLQSLAKKTTAEKEQLGLPTNGYFWSSSVYSAVSASNVSFTYGSSGHDDKYDSGNKVLCVGD